MGGGHLHELLGQFDCVQERELWRYLDNRNIIVPSLQSELDKLSVVRWFLEEHQVQLLRLWSNHLLLMVINQSINSFIPPSLQVSLFTINIDN